MGEILPRGQWDRLKGKGLGLIAGTTALVDLITVGPIVAVTLWADHPDIELSFNSHNGIKIH